MNTLPTLEDHLKNAQKVAPTVERSAMELESEICGGRPAAVELMSWEPEDFAGFLLHINMKLPKGLRRSAAVAEQASSITAGANVSDREMVVSCNEGGAGYQVFE